MAKKAQSVFVIDTRIEGVSHIHSQCATSVETLEDLLNKLGYKLVETKVGVQYRNPKYSDTYATIRELQMIE
jgi:hypothetical protein